MNENEATLIKSDSIKIDDNTTAIVIYYYHREFNTDDKGHKHTVADKSFYRCAVLKDSNDNWKNLANNIDKDNPAEYFNLSKFGLQDNFILTSNKKIWTNKNMHDWINLKLTPNKLHTVDEFLHGHTMTTGKINKGKKTPGAFETDLPYLKTYINGGLEFSLESPENLPTGVWLTATKEKQPRKSPKIIKD